MPLLHYDRGLSGSLGTLRQRLLLPRLAFDLGERTVTCAMRRPLSECGKFARATKTYRHGCLHTTGFGLKMRIRRINGEVGDEEIIHIRPCLRGALLREVDRQPQLVTAVDGERLLLRPNHARDSLNVLAMSLQLLHGVVRESISPEIQALHIRNGENDLEEEVDEVVGKPVVGEDKGLHLFKNLVLAEQVVDLLDFALRHMQTIQVEHGNRARLQLVPNVPDEGARLELLVLLHLLEQAHVLLTQRSDERVALRHVSQVLVSLRLGGMEELQNLCDLLDDQRNWRARLLSLVEELVDLQTLQQRGLVALNENRSLPPALIENILALDVLQLCTELIAVRLQTATLRLQRVDRRLELRIRANELAESIGAFLQLCPEVALLVLHAVNAGRQIGVLRL